MGKRFKRLKKLPPQHMTIEGLNHQGRGIAKIEGKTTFVFNALEGEKITARYTATHSKYDEAVAVDILTPSNQRVTPKCPNFGICGGCQLQHIQHDTQLKIKENALLNLLEHSAGIIPKTVMTAISAEPWGYRRKARLSVRQVDKKGDTLVGFRERDARFVVDMSECHILIPEIGLKVGLLRKLLSSLDARNKIAQIEIAKGETDTALIFRNLISLTDQDQTLLKAFGQTHQLKIYLQPKDAKSVYPIFPDNADLYMSYQLDQVNFLFHPSGFIQINKTINDLMLKKAILLLDPCPTDRLLDLFCGIGNFSLPLAKRIQTVVGIEGSEDAVELAKLNASNNHLSNTEFYCHNLYEPLNNHSVCSQRFNKIIIDPPRQGAQDIIEQLPQWSPTHILYISCNPSTFSRDAKLICAQGYQLEQVGIMDMFSHTEHAEVMGLFVQ